LGTERSKSCHNRHTRTTITTCQSVEIKGVNFITTVWLNVTADMDRSEVGN